jgi:hypothetical protein
MAATFRISPRCADVGLASIRLWARPANRADCRLAIDGAGPAVRYLRLDCGFRRRAPRCPPVARRTRRNPRIDDRPYSGPRKATPGVATAKATTRSGTATSAGPNPLAQLVLQRAPLRASALPCPPRARPRMVPTSSRRCPSRSCRRSFHASTTLTTSSTLSSMQWTRSRGSSLSRRLDGTSAMS